MKEQHEKLLKNSIELFAYYGYQDCNIQKLSSSIGLTKSSIYQYCESKEDLLIQCIEYCIYKKELEYEGMSKEESVCLDENFRLLILKLIIFPVTFNVIADYIGKLKKDILYGDPIWVYTCYKAVRN